MKKEETLLELVDNCPVAAQVSKLDDKGEAKLQRVKELHSLGFTKLADELEKDMASIKLNRIADYKYIRISDEMISAFLKRKVERYDREHQEKKEKPVSGKAFLAGGSLFDNTIIREEMSRQRRQILERIRDNTMSKCNSESKIIQDELLEHYKRNGYPDLTAIGYFLGTPDYRQAYDIKIFGYYQAKHSWGENQKLDLPVSSFAKSLIIRFESSNKVIEHPTPPILPQFIAPSFESIRRIAGTSLGDMRTSVGEMWENHHLSEKTCDYLSYEEGKTGQYVWEEVKLEDYKGIPPKDALEALKEHQDRQVFDYFTIASVKGIKDPLLLGKINGVDDRYFIAQWSDDVCLDDLI